MTWMRRLAIALACVAAVSAAGPADAAKTALLIGNSDYEAKCAEDLPSVPNDVALMSTALASASWAIVTAADRNGIEMLTDVESNIPADSAKYVVYYSGHGEPALQGALVGPDCTRMSAADLMAALGDDAARTLLILDSCGSGAFADAANAIDARICTITATTGTDCAAKGVFTPCFTTGLNGAADADDDGMITVQEAATYAIANCGDGATTPTWDGDCADCMIGMGPVSIEARTWGGAKARYR